jgi:hypothetical protein
MTLISDAELRDVKEITKEEKILIRAFLQGAVYCWCKNRPNEWFSLRDLMGGENFHWQGTPLMPLYEKHEGVEDAVARAGKDCGWMLKRVINDDSRIFETQKSEMIRQYRWVQSVVE